MRRLAALADAGRLGSGQVRSAAGALGVYVPAAARPAAAGRTPLQPLLPRPPPRPGGCSPRHRSATSKSLPQPPTARSCCPPGEASRECGRPGSPAPGLIPSEPGSMPASPMIKASTWPPERGVGGGAGDLQGAGGLGDGGRLRPGPGARMAVAGRAAQRRHVQRRHVDQSTGHPGTQDRQAHHREPPQWPPAPHRCRARLVPGRRSRRAVSNRPRPPARPSPSPRSAPAQPGSRSSDSP